MEFFGLPSSVLVFWGIYLPTIAVGVWKGGTPERIGTAILATMPIVQVSLYAIVAPRYDAVDPVSLTVDFVGVIGFGYLALNACRIWPIFACAFQLLSFAGHFARAFELSGHPLVYAWMKSTPTLAAALSALLGTILFRCQARRWGEEKPWVDWTALRGQPQILNTAVTH
jgi:hypothetical protein